MSEQNMSEIEKILDENNTDPISLYNENGEQVSFEQIAVIPLDGTVYVMLKPITPVTGVGEDEALVFEITEIEDEDALVIVDREEDVDAVFEEYYKLLREAGIDVD